MIEKIKQASLKLKSGLKNPKHKEKWQKIAGLLIISLFVAASVFVNQGAWAKFYRTTAPTTGFSYGYGYGFEAGYGYGYGYGSADYASDSSVADYGYLMSQRYPSSSVSGITRTGATVTITTTYKALAKVKYGTTSGSLTNETSYSSSYSTSTSVALSSLSCGTTYYYKAVVKDIGGNEWEETSEQSFETLACVSGGGGGGDYSAPVISNIEVTVSSSTATIAWETNEPSISWIVYGTSTDYGLEVKTTSYVTSHSVTLTDLTPETTYHYQIKSKDSSGNVGNYTDKTFTTLSEEEAEEVGEKKVEGEKPIEEMSIEELRAKIEEITKLINQLKARLAQLTGAAYEGCTITSFDRNLSQGMSGDDVKCLQIILNSDPDTQLAETGVGSPGNETNYFGPLTKAAVIKFQEKYADEVLAPWGLTKGTGYVGRTTRAKLNKLLTGSE